MSPIHSMDQAHPTDQAHPPGRREPGLPKIGLNLVQVPAARIVEAAVLAEQLGFESVWLGEHVAVPARIESPYPGRQRPFDIESPFLEPLITLAHLAAVTSRIRLGTSVIILPARDFIFTARALTTLDVLSGGRLEIGAGVGWMREGYEIAGRDFARRGLRMDEMLQALGRVFTDSRPEFHGRFIDFPEIGFEPKPVQPGGPRIHLGGSSERAILRTARFADGWLGGSGVPLAEVPDTLERLRDARCRLGREDPLEISLLRYEELDQTAVAAACAVGVHRVVLSPWGRDVHPGGARSLDAIESMAHRVGLEKVE
jgi:probable F420-dependent oxidoreductase